jgi:anti-sigma factor RsiW
VTMPDIKITWEVLNAYVDGELDRATSAKVAAAAAQDAMLAARIATLSRLKASTTGPDPFAAPVPPPPITPKRRQLASWRTSAIAAGLALILAGAILIQGRHTPKAEQPWLTEALAAQRQWIASASQKASRDRSTVTLGAAMAARTLDLSDADLKLVYAAAMAPIAGSETMFLGYRGPHGCMVGLWIGAPQDGIDSDSVPKKLDVGNFRVRAWRDDASGYALLSRGMDPARIDRLAEAVARLTDPRHIADDSIRTALREVPRTGIACRV